MPCIILYQPEIPPNTGNIIRLVANCGFTLHLIEPLGFSIDEKSVRRAGMDYKLLANVHSHKTLDLCLESINNPRLLIISTKGEKLFNQVSYTENDALLFGNEGHGLPNEVWQKHQQATSIKIPMKGDSRSLNLSNAAAIISYHCWMQLGFNGSG